MTALELHDAFQNLTLLHIGSAKGFIVGISLRWEGRALIAENIDTIVEDGTGHFGSRKDVHRSEFRALSSEEVGDIGAVYARGVAE